MLDRPFLIGEKVYLRPLDMDDLEGDYLNWINDEDVIRNLATTFPTTKQQLEEYVQSVLSSKNYSFFAVIEKETGKHIGNVKVGPIDWINRLTNYGRMMGDKGSWGKGYGTEVLKLIQRYVFEKLNLHKLFDMAIASNEGSIKSNIKAGFKIEATLKEHIFHEGKYVDVVALSITSDEYFNRSK
jgi:RimJ/RimL family protein N-acetyltransferase